ncbi:testin-like [Petromyzon marinus]|uniref:testin-like n=1 Tax=Petromyzon marinus TaxID=7757 RepID=UPI003F6E8DBE
MDLDERFKKVTISHEWGAGAPCSACKDRCPGLELHYWRRVCVNCKCSPEQHLVEWEQAGQQQQLQQEDLKEGSTTPEGLAGAQRSGSPLCDGAVGHCLLPSSSSSPQSMKLRDVNGDGGKAPPPPPPPPPVPAPSSPPLAPAQNGKRGVAEREQRAAVKHAAGQVRPSPHQVTEAPGGDPHVNDRGPRDEATLSMADCVPHWAPVGANGGPLGKPPRGPPGARTPPPETHAEASSLSGDASAAEGLTLYVCWGCGGTLQEGERAVSAVSAVSAGGEDARRMWHVRCFVCSTCREPLASLLYYWDNGSLFCHLHYQTGAQDIHPGEEGQGTGAEAPPVCARCNEPIVSCEYTRAEGRCWHLDHFCCLECGVQLAGQTYVAETEQPVCLQCYRSSYAKSCEGCGGVIDAEEERVAHGPRQWHARPSCFRCSGCSCALVQRRFIPAGTRLYCSLGCRDGVPGEG